MNIQYSQLLLNSGHKVICDLYSIFIWMHWLQYIIYWIASKIFKINIGIIRERNKKIMYENMTAFK